MKMYVWDDHEEVFVVAQAETVAQARDLALANIDEQAWEGDTHRKFAGYVTNVQPAIWMGPNADATLKVDGMVADLQIECNRHASKCDELMRENARLRKALEEASRWLPARKGTPASRGATCETMLDVMELIEAALAPTPEAPK